MHVSIYIHIIFSKYFILYIIFCETVHLLLLHHEHGMISPFLWGILKTQSYVHEALKHTKCLVPDCLQWKTVIRYVFISDCPIFEPLRNEYLPRRHQNPDAYFINLLKTSDTVKLGNLAIFIRRATALRKEKLYQNLTVCYLISWWSIHIDVSHTMH